MTGAEKKIPNFITDPLGPSDPNVTITEYLQTAIDEAQNWITETSAQMNTPSQDICEYRGKYILICTIEGGEKNHKKCFASE